MNKEAGSCIEVMELASNWDVLSSILLGPKLFHLVNYARYVVTIVE